jgi:hypothetical protein
MTKVFLHREVPAGANAKAILVVRPETHAIAWLNGRRTKAERLTRDGDRERTQVLSELTIEHRAEASEAYVSGFSL